MKTQQVLLIIGTATSIISLSLLGLGIFTTSSSNRSLIQSAYSQATTPAYAQCGQVSEEYDLNITTRKYTFFNFTNPFEVFWFNHTPIFTELPAQLYQQSQKFNNVTFSDAGKTINYEFEVILDPLNTSEVANISTVNLGPLGYWYSAKNLPPNQMTFYGLSNLIFTLQESLLTGVQRIALMNECLVSFAVAAQNVLTPSGITDPVLQNFIWTDPVYGLGSVETLKQWILALSQGPLSDSAYILQDYFYLTPAQTNGLFQSSSLRYCFEALDTTISNGYACTSDPCDPNKLMITQWASQSITKYPVAGIFPSSPSASIFNSSIQGYAEISYFLSDYFLVNEPVDKTRYQGLTFIDQAPRLLNFTPATGNMYFVCTNEDTLLHSGNLAFIYEVGSAFDALGNISDLTPLQPIVERFGLSSQEQAHVIWKYIEYLQSEFIEKQQSGGTAAEVVLGQFSTEIMTLVFPNAFNFVPMDLTGRVMAAQIRANSSNCTQIFQASSITLTSDQITTICQSPILRAFNEDSLSALYASCITPNGDVYNRTLYNIGTMTSSQFYVFCNMLAPNSFMSYAASADLYLKNHYNCALNYPAATRCSQRELVVMQWANSTVTMNVPPLLSDQFTPSLTLRDWYPYSIWSTFPPIEYLAAIQPLAQNFASDPSSMDPIPNDKANVILTYDALFNQVTVQNAFLAFNNQNWSWFEDNLSGVTPYPMITYLRYLTIQFFGGFNQINNAERLLWGYSDFFLTMVSYQPVYQFGDPSLNPVVSLAGSQDATLFSASVHTGIDNRSLTGQYISIDGLNTITYNQTYFDGNETTSALLSPWAENIPLAGTTGSLFASGLDPSDDLAVYLSDINFIAPLTYNSTQSYLGVNTYRYMLSNTSLLNKSRNPENAKWFADEWNGLINISMLENSPLFISKGHLLDADPVLQDAIKVYTDSSLTQLVTPSAADDTYFDVEPISGATLKARIPLQLNYEFKQDSLIPNSNYGMLPILLTEREMNFTSKSVIPIEAFADLIGESKFKGIDAPVFFMLAAAFFMITLVVLWMRRTLVQKTAIKGESHYYAEGYIVTH